MRQQKISVVNAPVNEASVFIDGVLLGRAPYVGNIPLCAQRVVAVWKGKMASAMLMGEDTPADLHLILAAPKKDEQDELLGFIPPRCRKPEGVDQECVSAWLEYKKREFEQRDSHTHHEGCAH